MQETVGSVSDTPMLAGPRPTDITIDTLTFTVPTMAPPTCIILAFGGFRRPMVPASGGACGPASEINKRPVGNGPLRYSPAKHQSQGGIIHPIPGFHGLRVPSVGAGSGS